MILIIEGDEICYRAAFACQKQCYKVKTPRGEYDFKNKYTKTDIVGHFRRRNKVLDVDYNLIPYHEVEEEFIVKHTLDVMVEKLWDYKIDNKKVKEVHLWLSSPDNFRYSVVNIPGPKGLGYKAGRPPKPHWLQVCKERLMSKHGAQILACNEADDALGIFAGKGKCVVHIDKDINMVDGWHLNHVTGEVYCIEKGLGEGNRGLRFFYKQLLTGDATDNIPGCKNPAKAHFKEQPNFSGDSAEKVLVGLQTEEQYFNVIRNMYRHTYGNSWEEALKEVADLVWIKRWKDETGSQYLQNRGLL